MNYSQAESLAVALSSMLDCKGTVGLKIAYNLRKLNDELKEYHEFKQELFKKYGEEKEGNLVINKESENFPLFMNELKPIESQEIEVNLRRFNESELAGSNLTAKQMSMIWELVDETI